MLLPPYTQPIAIDNFQKTHLTYKKSIEFKIPEDFSIKKESIFLSAYEKNHKFFKKIQYNNKQNILEKEFSNKKINIKNRIFFVNWLGSSFEEGVYLNHFEIYSPKEEFDTYLYISINSHNEYFSYNYEIVKLFTEKIKSAVDLNFISKIRKSQSISNLSKKTKITEKNPISALPSYDEKSLYGNYRGNFSVSSIDLLKHALITDKTIGKKAIFNSKNIKVQPISLDLHPDPGYVLSQNFSFWTESVSLNKTNIFNFIENFNKKQYFYQKNKDDALSKISSILKGIDEALEIVQILMPEIELLPLLSDIFTVSSSSVNFADNFENWKEMQNYEKIEEITSAKEKMRLLLKQIGSSNAFGYNGFAPTYENSNFSFDFNLKIKTHFVFPILWGATAPFALKLSNIYSSLQYSINYEYIDLN